MDKKQALKKAKEAYQQILANIEIAQKICDKVDLLLPLGWHSRFFGEFYLEFRPLYPHKASAAEFRTVCDIVEKITKVKLHRRASGDEDKPRLVASNYYDFGNDAWLSMWVESSADETCKITFREEKKLFAIADERCLGRSHLESQEAR